MTTTRHRNSYEPLAGTVALVTGSARGLGMSIALQMCAAGADVAIHYRSSKTEAEALAARIRSTGRKSEAFQADLAYSSQGRDLVSEVVDTFGRLDHLIHNVGPFMTTPFTRLSEQDWDYILTTNLKAAWVIDTQAAPWLRSHEAGHIIHIGANSSLVRTHSIYGLAKASLSHLTESLAVELSPHITVNCIAPGMIEGTEPDEATRATVLDRTPLRRLVTADEVAGMCVLMCTPAFASITGRTLIMDGGRWLR